jgi:hypothetical protein
VIHFQRQPRDEGKSGAGASKKGDPTQYLTKYDHRNSLEEIFEEKVIQDKRPMNVLYGYKEYPKPEFFQGPQFVIYKEQSKLRNHKYPDTSSAHQKDDDELCYEIAPYPPKRDMKPPRYQKPERKRSHQEDSGKKEKKPKVKEEVFDMNLEKKKGNKAWREIQQSAEERMGSKGGKKKGRTAGLQVPNLIKRESAKDGKRQGGKGKGGAVGGKDRR